MYNIWSDSKMKKNIFLTICLLMLTLAFQSCDKSEDVIDEDAVNCVEYFVSCNKPDAELILYRENPIDYHHKGDWHKEYMTKKNYTWMHVGCKDPEVEITVTLYVNGVKKLVKKEHDMIFFTYILKGNGPAI